MSSHQNRGISTAKLGQWIKAAHLVPLTDAECYERIYGKLVVYVEHYRPRINLSPGAINYYPEYLSKHIHFGDTP